MAISAVIISPEWDADSYKFQCEGTGSADFVIESKPDWLDIDRNSGKFSNSIGTINGKATTDSQYSKIGIYIDQMLINSGGKKYAVPLYYITEGNPKIQVNSSFEVSYNNYYNQFQISNKGDGILLWDIVSMPDWLTVDIEQFNLMSLLLGQEATTYIPFTFDLEKALQSNNLKVTIVLKTNDKNSPLVEIQVTTNLGNPDFNIFENPLNFEVSETSKIFRVYNHGDGIVLWKIEGLPEWLAASPANGVLTSYTSNDITISCDKSKLQAGLNTATIYLKSSDTDRLSIAVTVTVRVAGISENVRVLNGNIVEATFDKNTNTMYYITSQPNKLVTYDVIGRTILHEVDLSKAPTCMAVSEDFTKAVVGHGGMISLLNLTDYSITKTYDTDNTIFDAEWADNDWFCYTISNSSTSRLSWINTSTGETTQSDINNNSFGTAYLEKVPNQPFIIAARKNISPSGIFVFNTDSKTLKSYTHETLGNLWFFNDGELVVSGYSNIIRTSSITSVTGNSINDTPTIGELKYDNFKYSAWWIDVSPVNQSIYAILSYHADYYFPPVNAKIYQFEDNDYSFVKTYTFDNYFQPDAQTTAYEVEARYVFANSEGTELSVLRKGKDNNNWSVEFIPIQ